MLGAHPRRLGILPLAFLAASLCLAQDIPSALDAAVANEAKAGKFSGSVLVAREGKVLLAKGYGMANYELDVPNGPKTKFRIGSVTKQFSAAAILQLEEKGKLSVQDSICKFVENCPDAWQKVTIHHLLSHTGGVPNFTSLPDYIPNMYRPMTLAEMLARFRDKPLAFAPGEKMQYSNSGYMLIGQAIEKASQMTYEEYVDRNFVEPLRLSGTGYDRHRKLLKNRATGYSRSGGGLVNSAYIDMSQPHAAGALYSTVEDLCTWDTALHSGKVISQASLAKMLTPVKNNYGYGQFIDNVKGRKRVWHGGGINGFMSALRRYPDQGVTIVVLTNVEGTNAVRMADTLAAVLFGEPL